MSTIVKALLHQSKTNKPGNQPIPAGLEPVGTELAELATRFGRLVSHNAMTYQPFYHDILEHKDTTTDK